MEDSPDPAVRERAVQEANALGEADRLRRLFAATGNGLVVWRIFALYRRAGLPVPEDVLGAFDRFAGDLEQARGADAIARALRMSPDRGGSGGRAALSRSTAKLARLEHVAAAMRHRDLTLGTAGRRSDREVIARVAAERGESESLVRKAWYEARRVGQGARSVFTPRRPSPRGGRVIRFR